MGLGEPIDERKQRVHRRLVGADDDPAPANLLQLADGDFGVGGQRQQPAGVLLEQTPGVGQRAVADDRSNSRSPSSSSSRRIAWLTAGCVRCSFLAATREAAFRGNGHKCCPNPAVASAQS